MIYLSSMTMLEQTFGTERLCLRKSVEDQIRGTRIRQENDFILATLFDDHILTAETNLMARAGAIRAAAERICGDIGVVDAILAATAEFHNIPIVTNNVRHFQAAGVSVIDSRTLIRPDSDLRLVM